MYNNHNQNYSKKENKEFSTEEKKSENEGLTANWFHIILLKVIILMDYPV